MLEEYFGIAIGELGIAPSEFWLMTPAEMNIASRYLYKSRMAYYDNISLSFYSAHAKAMSGKKFEPIFNKTEQKQKKAEQKISKEDKQKELNYLRGLFN